MEVLELFAGLPAPVWKRLTQTPEYAAIHLEPLFAIGSQGCDP